MNTAENTGDRGRVIGLQERRLGRTVLRTYRTKVDIEEIVPNDRQPRLGPKEDDELQRQIEANVERLRTYAESSPSIGTALTPYIGYEAAAEVVKESARTGESIRHIVRTAKLMSDAELDRALDVEAMTRGGIVG